MNPKCTGAERFPAHPTFLECILCARKELSTALGRLQLTTENRETINQQQQKSGLSSILGDKKTNKTCEKRSRGSLFQGVT